MWSLVYNYIIQSVSDEYLSIPRACWHGTQHVYKFSLWTYPHDLLINDQNSFDGTCYVYSDSNICLLTFESIILDICKPAAEQYDVNGIPS